MNQIPPLRQSTYETMSCPHSYGLIHIQGLKPPDSLASSRGTEVHSILAAYVTHCAQRRVPADYGYLDALCSSVGEEAAQILETCRESFTVDWQNFFVAETTFALDVDFDPTRPVDVPEKDQLFVVCGIDDPNPNPPAYSGTLDTIYLMPGNKVARIIDYKSHPRPFDPTTFQAKLYSLALFIHMPELQEIEFVLRFVRYPNVQKPIKFFRSDVPGLMEDMRRVRARQFEYHAIADRIEDYDLQAIPGTHCTYCPAITDFSCPVAKLNPMLNLSPNERLAYRLWHDVANRANNQAMQQYVDGTGMSIEALDANGKSYTFGPVQRESTTYPLFVQNPDGSFTMPIPDELINWSLTEPKDMVPRKGSRPWLCNLTIGATKLKSYLKTNKREIVHNAIRDLAVTETKIQLKVTRDSEVDDGTGEEHREWDPAGDQEIEF